MSNFMIAVDTNVLLYSIDRIEPAKQLKAQLLLQHLRSASPATVLLWQVLGELGQQLRRWRDQGKLSPQEYLQHIQAFRYVFPIVMPVASVLDESLILAERHTLSHWDSMLVAACKAAAVGTLYTEDMGSPRTIDGIQLMNPFI